METLLKFFATFIPFLNPYPLWVKLAVSAVIITSAIALIGIIVAAPTSHEAAAKSDSRAFLIIHGVTLYGGHADAIQLTAIINGTNYVYPTLDGVDWAEVGDTMAPQTFQIPIAPRYDVSFSMKAQRRHSDFKSVETQSFNGGSDGAKIYHLHEVNNRTRGAAISADVNYEIKAP
jgi:hypothetical protein